MDTTTVTWPTFITTTTTPTRIIPMVQPRNHRREKATSFHILQPRYYFTNLQIPPGIWRKNDVVLTLMRRHHVASTSVQRHFGTICPLWYSFFRSLRPLFVLISYEHGNVWRWVYTATHVEWHVSCNICHHFNTTETCCMTQICCMQHV